MSLGFAAAAGLGAAGYVTWAELQERNAVGALTLGSGNVVVGVDTVAEEPNWFASNPLGAEPYPAPAGSAWLVVSQGGKPVGLELVSYDGRWLDFNGRTVDPLQPGALPQPMWEALTERERKGYGLIAIPHGIARRNTQGTGDPRKNPARIREAAEREAAQAPGAPSQDEDCVGLTNEECRKRKDKREATKQVLWYTLGLPIKLVIDVVNGVFGTNIDSDKASEGAAPR